MKKYFALFIMLLLFVSGCTPTEIPTQQPTEGPTATVTPNATPNADAVDPYAENGGRNMNLLCGIDKHGRVFMPISGVDEKKQVGIYYFVWHGMDVKMTGTYNITELLKNDPDSLWNDSLGAGSVSPVNTFHYWDEPLFGYYRSTDRWVIAKHMEMLTLADIDFLYVDVTNADPYFRSCTDLFLVMKEMIKKGWDVPRVVFYTNSYSILTIERIYNYFYTKKTYDEIWYRPDGVHPMIIGNYTPETDRAEARKRGDNEYDPKPLSQKITDFFDLRAAQWPDDEFNFYGIPWNEWSFPQPIHNRVMNVSLAQHPNLPFSNSVTLGRQYNWGRGYNYTTKENVEADAELGTNVQAQWDNVIKKKDKVDMVTVTGWNEWTAIKLVDPNYGPKVYFVDTTNAEFSRDIEPQRNGGFEDSYYLQLIDNVRRFKSVSGKLALPAKASGDLMSAAAWDDIKSIYYTGVEKAYERNSTSAGDVYIYKQDAPRNNLQYVKVADDGENVYFMVQSEADLTATGDASFLNVFIGADSLERKGWEGYEFVVEAASKKLMKLDANGKRTAVGDVTVSVSGKSAVIKVPVSALGATEGIYFKVTDNFNSANIMDSYTEGKCIPMGRLSWYYYLAK